ncbi:RluA family pseudouridine synthase [Gracilibacillus alcaliphilus]|uniref:RluA family pseudouridine synthase n=1 Tax=Gracilibacillus alcaliphilus TaxID=1401441 RepID=UPI00195AA9D9|nr:RluA family pseudouridine synthase [Gracilibacillus alcaliphilus]MBM7675479.1 23S rRNA pseudouridine1911/1915/1917 synthase [Gracilibacillus alcaliphilus]
MKWKVHHAEEGLLLRDYLRQVRHISRSVLTAVKFDGGKLLVNEEEVNVRYRLAEGDWIEVIFPPEERSEQLIPKPIQLDIVYEDDDVLVLHKPAYLATMPSPYHPEGTLANGIIHYYEEHDIPYTVHVVTRLDRDTSGLLLVAKHRYSHSLLFQQQQQHKVTRHYQAIVSGHFSNKKGTLNSPIDRVPGSIMQRQVTETGQAAVTHYQVIAELTQVSLLDIHLETGRTHQIRVHMSAEGHPLIGDQMYGGDTERLTRQALHCWQLAFYQPITGEPLSFQLPLPEDMQQAWGNYQGH